MQAMIIDGDESASSILSSILRSGGKYDVARVSNNGQAWQALRTLTPDLFFVQISGARIDGVVFTRQLRRSDLPCRKAAVIMLASQPTAAAIVKARDAGVHEFLRKPFTIQDVICRLEAVTQKPRNWVEGIHYIGPDRRRFNSAEFSGARKRQMDKEDASSKISRIDQALKIMKAAVKALDTDPHQALRSLHAQADELEAAAIETRDWKAAAAAQLCRDYVETALSKGRFSSSQLTDRAEHLKLFDGPGEDETPGRLRRA
jgi:DNA-binding response OmpR family regulator